MKLISPSDWLELRKHVPKQFHNLVEACYNLEKMFHWLISDGNMQRIPQLNMFFGLAFRIIREYIYIVQLERGTDDEQIKKIREDIRLSLSTILEIDRHGNIFRKNIIPDVMMHYEKGNIEDYIATIIEPVMTFIHSVIYDSLKSVIDKLEKSFVSNFVRESTLKALAITAAKKQELSALIEEGEGAK